MSGASSPEQVAVRLRAEASRREATAEARASILRARCIDAVALLRIAGAREVWLFGSLVDGPRAESDVDLAVLGLPSAAYFEVLTRLMTLFGTRVDLVRLEDAPESLRDSIRQTGRPL